MANRILWIIMAVALTLAAGCSRKVRYVPYEIRQERESVLTDSVSNLLMRVILSNRAEREKEEVYVFNDRFVMVNDNGDTLKDKERTVVDRNRERESELRVYEARIDSLKREIVQKDSLLAEKPVPVEIPVEVERELTWWERTQMIGFRILVGLICVGFLWTWLKRRYLLK